MHKLLQKLLAVAAVAAPSLVLAEGTVTPPAFNTDAANVYAGAVKTGVTDFVNGAYMETLGAIAIAFLIVSLVMLIIKRARNPR